MLNTSVHDIVGEETNELFVRRRNRKYTERLIIGTARSRGPCQIQMGFADKAISTEAVETT